MKKNYAGWNDKEVAVAMDKTLTSEEVATKLGRTFASVDTKRGNLRRNGKLSEWEPMKRSEAKKQPVVPADAVADKKAHDDTYWQNQHRQLNSEYHKLVKDSVMLDRWFKHLAESAPTSYTPAPRYLGLPELKARASRTTPESAVLLFSDTHIGKVTRREQTLGFRDYNFQVFLSELKFLEQGVISILREHTNSEINELVIAMLGDMLDGALGHGVEAGQRTVLFNQFYQGAHAIAQFFRNVSAHVKKVRIKTCVGNHTRFQNQKRMPTENRHSNFDQFLYALLEALTKNIKNIEWSLDEQPFTVFEVEGWTFMGAHGDHWRGGDKAMGIPLHALARQINSTTQLFHKNDVAVPNYYISGHLHRGIQLPHGLGDITINGGFPGLDNYALDGNFNPVDPTQTFFKVHPKYGKTASYQLQLKYADLNAPTYDLPGKFKVE